MQHYQHENEKNIIQANLQNMFHTLINGEILIYFCLSFCNGSLYYFNCSIFDAMEKILVAVEKTMTQKSHILHLMTTPKSLTLNDITNLKMQWNQRS